MNNLLEVFVAVFWCFMARGYDEVYERGAVHDSAHRCQKVPQGNQVFGVRSLKAVSSFTFDSLNSKVLWRLVQNFFFKT